MSASIATNGWDDRALLDLVTIKSGQVDPREATYRDLPLIAPDHLASQTGRLIKKESAAAQGAISGKYLVRPGDVIYSKIRPYLQKAYKCDFVALCSADMYPLTPRPGVDSSFILHSILGRDFTNFAVSVSARSGIPKINREELAEYRMRVPREEEQRAIAWALDDADDLIATLERLIAKKQAIKQGMMQQLLTGRTRMPGFSHPWQCQRISDLVADLEAGVSVRSTTGLSYGPSILKTSSVDRGRFIPSEAKLILSDDVSRARCSPVAGSMIVSRMNTPALVGDVGYVSDSHPDLFLPDRLWLVRSKAGSQTDMHWLTFYFASESGARLLRSLATGTSGSMKNIPKDRVLSLEIAAPHHDEQAAIANVLADADIELDRLRRRLTKARAIKVGMMQQLLTGRIRLSVETV